MKLKNQNLLNIIQLSLFCRFVIFNEYHSGCYNAYTGKEIFYPERFTNPFRDTSG